MTRRGLAHALSQYCTDHASQGDLVEVYYDNEYGYWEDSVVYDANHAINEAKEWGLVPDDFTVDDFEGV